MSFVREGDGRGPRGKARSLAAIFGLAGPVLSEAEARFFAEADPLGFILFARNVETPDQVRALTGALRACVGRPDAPILIDQEGGRVQRLRPPHWPDWPAMGRVAAVHKRDPERAVAALDLIMDALAASLRALGVDVDCAPVLDVPQPGAHGVIGDRAFGRDPEVVAKLGRRAAERLLAGGVLPVIKHIPGHGRALADSHLALPRVDAERALLERIDFRPFRALADLPIAMTAHVVYSALDAHRPATWSASVIQDVIRRDIGFDGLLLSDDLCMKALEGDYRDRAWKALDAGCDVVLHCSGDLDEMHGVVDGAAGLSDQALERWRRARAALDAAERPGAPDPGAHARVDRLLAGV